MKIRIIILQLITLAVVASCSAVRSEYSCTQTIQSFVSKFNQQDVRGIRSLFQPRILGSKQVKMMNNNLIYVYEVAGKIQSINYNEQEGSKISYTSIHENTAMDLIFQLNDRCQLMSYLIKTHYPDSLPQLVRNTTSLTLPFQGEWYVEWGGFTIDQNYHNAHRNMKGAIDFSIQDQEGRLFSNQGKKNEDYYAFNQPVIAPCKAVVVKVIDGIEDNRIGKPNALDTYGNLIVLKAVNEEYLLMAHLKRGSILVKAGQTVNPGEVLAHCGNSGYSTKPHLHFVVQNVPDLFHPTGAYSYFKNITVDGELKQDHSPVQGELVSNSMP
ncbi:MAG: hypothetical protein DHS20C17_27350 [Cyclobacteriaceae bacterium]|nr:MAG: hypothetical protein DHS20C17_27350 [Cyclobacteriaceae bacterium]